MCVVVSGCPVIVILLQSEHILNKQKLIRLILFLTPSLLFFLFLIQARHSLPIQMWNVKLEWCSVSRLLCWHRVTEDNGITQKIMSLSHLLPSRSTLIFFFPSSCASGCVDFQLLIYPLIVVSFNPTIFYLALFQLGRRPQCCILNTNLYFPPLVYVCVCVRPCVIVLGEVSQLAGKLNHCLSILRSFTAPHKHKWPTAENEKALITFFPPHVTPAVSAADAPH